MNPPKVNEYDYINFLIAAQKAYSCAEAERVQPESANPAAHDAVNRLLHRMEPSSEQLWQEAEVSLNQGILVADDSTVRTSTVSAQSNAERSPSKPQSIR